MTSRSPSVSRAGAWLLGGILSASTGTIPVFLLFLQGLKARAEIQNRQFQLGLTLRDLGEGLSFVGGQSGRRTGKSNVGCPGASSGGHLAGVMARRPGVRPDFGTRWEPLAIKQTEGKPDEGETGKAQGQVGLAAQMMELQIPPAVALGGGAPGG